MNSRGSYSEIIQTQTDLDPIGSQLVSVCMQRIFTCSRSLDEPIEVDAPLRCWLCVRGQNHSKRLVKAHTFKRCALVLALVITSCSHWSSTMAQIKKIVAALLLTSSHALRPQPTGTRMVVTIGQRMRAREAPKSWTPSALEETFGCPACGGDGCGVCGGGGLLLVQKQLKPEAKAAPAPYCGCGGLGCEACGGGMLLAPKRAAVCA